MPGRKAAGLGLDRVPARTIGSAPTGGVLMSEVTDYVALPFVAAEDGIAPAEAVGCFNPNAAVNPLTRRRRSTRPKILGCYARILDAMTGRSIPIGC